MARHPERIAASLRAPVAMRVTAVVLALTATALLAGCTDAGPQTPTGTSSSSPTSTASASATPTPTPTPTGPAEPVLVPDGTADDNLPLFAAVVHDVWDSPDKTAGRAYVDALVDAGFDKKAMQVTRDTSTVGNPAETIQFSVRWGKECLVGQVGPATGKPVAVIVPALPGGACLVGDTRPIDW